MTFFQTENLSITFHGLKALQEISFVVEKGQIYSVIGPNGAGKTTLFNCISGLYQPDQGDIRFKGSRIAKKKPHDIAGLGLGRTFQNIELFTQMKTIENLMLGRHRHMKTGFFRGMFMWGKPSFAAREEMAHRERVEHIIHFLDLESVRDSYVAGLPYGTQKRIELGRALALEPELLLLDEPCAGMNQEEKQEMMFMITDIRKDLDITILMIEHDMTLVMDVSDRILVMNFGKQICQGRPDEVRKDPEVLTAYLGKGD